MPAAAHRVSLPERYRVVRHIANGGMAAVWAAQDELLGRVVAVKVLSAGFAADEVAARRFEREARAAAKLSAHPNVVTIYDYGRHDGHPFIVMEYLAGGTIRERMRSDAPVPHALALQWLRQAGAALDAAHAAGVVHRDVKPGNLLLGHDDHLAVADFGIAMLAAETSLTQTGFVLGTAAYLSPEQRAGRMATPASDRYALAVVARELLPPGAAPAVIARGLAEDPAQRPATAVAFVDELQHASEAPRPRKRETTVTTRVAVTPPARRRTRPRALLALAALLAAAIVTVGLATSGDDVTPPRAKPQRGAAPARHQAPPATTAAPNAPAPPSPRALNDAGFAKLPGDPAGAIPLLQQSVAGFRAQGATSDINYAFALFNLGNALRLAGRPAEAIPYLQERLGISSFKRGVVAGELALARRQAGLAAGPKPGKHHGGGKGREKDG
jgi:serine/threonine protein kinase